MSMSRNRYVLYKWRDAQELLHKYEWDGFRIYFCTYETHNRDRHKCIQTTVLGLHESAMLSNLFVEIGYMPIDHSIEMMEIQESAAVKEHNL